MKKLLIIILLLALPGLCLADDSNTVVIFKCKLHDGKKMEEVQANNVRWLANARKNGGSEEINSYALEPQIGELDHFVFIDSYPDLATWAKAQSAEETEESKAINAAFEELMECEKNRMYKSTKH
jgi:hypothetical protein